MAGLFYTHALVEGASGMYNLVTSIAGKPFLFPGATDVLPAALSRSQAASELFSIAIIALGLNAALVANAAPEVQLPSALTALAYHMLVLLNTFARLGLGYITVGAEPENPSNAYTALLVHGVLAVLFLRRIAQLRSAVAAAKRR
ncbi:hypothetical protein T492DRAFT_194431 [Pavlovales sp. CCMP2436]|nr:hypothetical protein T492DRAFT_194431 [Pavlovales sp. CCMP2436]